MGNNICGKFSSGKDEKKSKPEFDENAVGRSINCKDAYFH